MKNLAMAKVRYWNEVEGLTENCNVLLYCNSFVDGVEQLEEYYGKELEKVEIELFDTGLWHVSDEVAASLIKDFV